MLTNEYKVQTRSQREIISTTPGEITRTRETNSDGHPPRSPSHVQPPASAQLRWTETTTPECHKQIRAMILF